MCERMSLKIDQKLEKHGVGKMFNFFHVQIRTTNRGLEADPSELSETLSW